MNPIPESPTIGLLGGSFNPPHLAHVMVAAWALAGGEVDEVWVIPTGGHPFGKPLAAFDERLDLCRLAFACFGERARLLDLEREPVVHYSIDTLGRLEALHPGRGWRWIMGSDTIEEAGQWKEFDGLMRRAPPLIVPRAGHLPPGRPAEFALPDVSSTLLRRLLAERRLEGLENLIPRPVLGRILAQGLYLNE
jgi:nicotinate-nucleotide adenylyltransferase